VKSLPSLPETLSGQQLGLAQLRRGQSGLVIGLVESAAIDAGRSPQSSLLARLRDLGFVPGARCEVVARMWPGGDPLAVRIGGSTFALRRAEAEAVRVQLVSETGSARAALPREGTSAVAA
jgi:ferrous iron transport protein A